MSNSAMHLLEKSLLDGDRARSSSDNKDNLRKPKGDLSLTVLRRKLRVYPA